jgi:hypothetical protein
MSSSSSSSSPCRHINDARYCPTERVFGIMQKTLLAFPVMGMKPQYARLCTPLQLNSKILHGKVDQADRLDELMMDEREAQCTEGDMEGSLVYTWKAAGSRLVTLIKAGHDQTIVFDHASKACFTASRAASLCSTCPEGTSLLGQVIVDRIVPESASGGSVSAGGDNDDESQDEEWNARILIFDIISYGNEHNFADNGCKASIRYDMLMSVKQIFELCNGVKIQWAGQLQALMDFGADNRESMPHIIDGLIQLGIRFPNKARLVRWSTEEEN